jgi:DNA-binding transcriptional LysR family regulator
VGAVREGHPLLAADKITPKRYAAYDHVVVSRRGSTSGPVDQALAALGLKRTILAVVPGFSEALAIASTSDLVALVTASFHNAAHGSQPKAIHRRTHVFALPVQTEPVTVSQIWHPRVDADPAHRWLRGLLLTVCRD